MFTQDELLIHDLDELHATVRLKVPDLEKLKAFLDEKDLQTFLTDPFDMNEEIRGCRIHVSANMQTQILTLQRDMKQTTIYHIAYLDLIHTIARFIWENINAADWEDLLRGHTAKSSIWWKRAQLFQK